MPELPTAASAMVSEPSGPEVWDKTSESGVIELPYVSIMDARKEQNVVEVLL